jgi:hypothetical protein
LAFISRTKDSMQARSVSPSERTAQQIASLYGATFVDSDTLLVYVWLRDGAVPANVTLLSPDSPLGSLSTWSARLNSTCHEFASLALSAAECRSPAARAWPWQPAGQH